jgi:hypothetical protein
MLGSCHWSPTTPMASKAMRLFHPRRPVPVRRRQPTEPQRANDGWDGTIGDGWFLIHMCWFKAPPRTTPRTRAPGTGIASFWQLATKPRTTATAQRPLTTHTYPVFQKQHEPFLHTLQRAEKTISCGGRQVCCISGIVSAIFFRS